MYKTRNATYLFLRAFILAGLFVCMYSSTILAQTDTTTVSSSLDSLIKWLAYTIGGAAVAIGIIWTGIMMAQHDPDALKKGVWVIIGGILIFAAPKIVQMIKTWAGM